MKQRHVAKRAFRLGIVSVVAGLFYGVIGLAPTTAGAVAPDNASQACTSGLQGGVDDDLHISTTPVGGTTVLPGDEIDVTLTWGATVWNDISKIVICSSADGVLDEGSIYHEAPGDDDGTASTTFTVPADAETMCVWGRMSGNPGPGNTSDDTHKTGQVCFPIAEPCEFDPSIPADDPNCGECEEGQLGEFPNCEDPCEFDETIPASDPNCGECDEGDFGEFPSCEEPCEFDETMPADDPNCGECEEGQLGEFPNCEEPCEFDETMPADDPNCGECEEGQLGEFPNCEEPCEFDETMPADDPNCGECEEGQLGEFPNCEEPCEFDETMPADDPNCGECEEGQLGEFPSCEEPCEFDETMPADDPNCGECEEGQLGEFPNCEEPCEFDETIPASDPGCEEDEVLPRTETPTTPKTPETPEVEGRVTLPRTGADTAPMAELAMGLIALGSVLVRQGRKRSAA